MKENRKVAVVTGAAAKEVLDDMVYQTPDGLMEVRIQNVEFVKQKKGGETIRYKARIITYCDIRKHKLISLLTNDMDSDPDETIAVYSMFNNPEKDWEIMLLKASGAPPEPSLFD